MEKKGVKHKNTTRLKKKNRFRKIMVITPHLYSLPALYHDRFRACPCLQGGTAGRLSP